MFLPTSYITHSPHLRADCLQNKHRPCSRVTGGCSWTMPLLAAMTACPRHAVLLPQQQQQTSPAAAACTIIWQGGSESISKCRCSEHINSSMH